MPQQVQSFRSNRRSGFTFVELLTVMATIVVLISLLLPAVQQAREAARQSQCRNNLMQIGVALNNYMMAHGVLPPGSQNDSGPIKSVTKDGYHMGWMTQILPFMEQQNLYAQIDFTKSIYDKTNDQVASFAINGFFCPSNPFTSSNGTCYRGVHHDVEAAINVNQNGVLFLNSSIDEDQITDGCSHTAFAMETIAGSGGSLGWASGTRASLCNAVIQTSQTADELTEAAARAISPTYELHPSTSHFQDANSLRLELARLESADELVGGPSSLHTGRFHVLMADSVVRSISTSIDAKVLRNMAHRADGELANH